MVCHLAPVCSLNPLEYEGLRKHHMIITTTYKYMIKQVFLFLFQFLTTLNIKTILENKAG